MKASPIISSFLLHLAVISLVVLCAAPARRPLSAVPPVYLDLSPAAPRLESEQNRQAPPAENVSPVPSKAGGKEVQRATPQPKPGTVAERLQLFPEPSAQPSTPASTQASAQPVAQAAPELSQAFARAAYQQQGMFRSRSYSEVVSLAVRKIVEGRIPFDTRRELDGVQAEVVADYPAEAPAVEVTSGNAILLNALRDPAAWRELPSPGQYRLQYRQVAFLVRIDRGTVHVGLTPR
ncbi:hypothetical protein [Geomonas sp. Red32]|uniref:hypothetical protein n=1 Tax=Geomonas sp. Red32 TaxID=2912856 RepID=UPI00202CB7C1|nr:hypothetical protein [Geomonas sp. Red32]